MHRFEFSPGFRSRVSSCEFPLGFLGTLEGLLTLVVLLPSWPCRLCGVVAFVALLPLWPCRLCGVVAFVALLPLWSVVAFVVLEPVVVRWSLCGPVAGVTCCSPCGLVLESLRVVELPQA